MWGSWNAVSYCQQIPYLTLHAHGLTTVDWSDCPEPIVYSTSYKLFCCKWQRQQVLLWIHKCDSCITVFHVCWQLLLSGWLAYIPGRSMQTDSEKDGCQQLLIRMQFILPLKMADSIMCAKVKKLNDEHGVSNISWWLLTIQTLSYPSLHTHYLSCSASSFTT